MSTVTVLLKNILLKIFDFFSSVKLAVLLIVTFAIILACGTFYEAEYGTADAQRVIYKSWYMSTLMFLLICNLACATIDRLPWRKHHIGFVITHLGIITLILGSFITQQRGIDGSIALGIQESAEHVTVDENMLVVYQNVSDQPFTVLHQVPVDFARRRPETHDYTYKLVDGDTLKVVGFEDKASRKVSAIPAEAGFAVVHFKLFNDRVKVDEWLGHGGEAPTSYDLGPASVSFLKGTLITQTERRNQILLYINPKTKKLHVSIFSARSDKPTLSSDVEPGHDYPTGWMNLMFRVEEFLPKANWTTNFVAAPPQDPNVTQALLLDVGGKRSWFELGVPREVTVNQTKYFIAFTRKRFPLGFQLKLKNFKIKTYGGTASPMSYESTVLVDGGGETVISMNEPLKFKDYTVYQASFEQNEKGDPTTSIFSVNYDPGRAIKYAGALCMVFGIIIMFYFKPKWTRKPRGT